MLLKTTIQPVVISNCGCTPVHRAHIGYRDIALEYSIDEWRGEASLSSDSESIRTTSTTVNLSRLRSARR